MSVAKNKLQDIYDAGVTRLDELERSQKASMKAACQGHIEAAAGAEKEVAERVELQAAEVEAEIGAMLDKSIARLKKTVDNEGQKTQALLKRLLDSVGQLGDRLRQSIADMKERHETTIGTVSEDSINCFDQAFENASAELQKEDFSASKNMKIQNTFAISSFQQKLDNALLEVRGEEKQYTSRLFKSYLQNANAIDSHTSGLGSRLSSQHEEYAGELETKFAEGNSLLTSQIEGLESQSDELSAETARNIHEWFERLAHETMSGVQANAEQYGAEMGRLRDSVKSELEESVSDWNRQTAEAADRVETALNSLARRLKETTEQILQNSGDDCRARIESGLALKDGLDKISSAILSGAAQDLAESRTQFQSRLNDSAQAASQRLAAAVKKAEEGIESARRAAEVEMSNLAGASRAQIEAALEKFLERINEMADGAVEEVRAAAGQPAQGSEPDRAPAKAEKPRKKSRTKEFVSEAAAEAGAAARPREEGAPAEE